VSGRHGGESRPGQRVTGPLDRWAPEAKLMGLLGFLLVVAVTPPERPMALAASGAVALAVAAAALVEPRALLRRLVLDVPLLVLAATYALAGRGPTTEVAGVSLSSEGLRVGLALLAKATIGIVAVSAMAATTTVIEVVAGLRRLRVPGWLCDLVGLSARQVGVIGDDLGRLRLAAAVRAGGQGRRRQWGAVAGALGMSFVRATERADRLQLAAQVRGGSAAGALVGASHPVPSATATMWIGAVLPAAGALAARVGL
jgi:cobalt/nickel transport system permease protein